MSSMLAPLPSLGGLSSLNLGSVPAPTTLATILPQLSALNEETAIRNIGANVSGKDGEMQKLLYRILNAAKVSGIDLINNDPSVMGKLIDDAISAWFGSHQAAINQMLSGHANECEARLRGAVAEATKNYNARDLSDADSGVGGMNQIYLPKQVYDYAGLEATFSLNAVSGMGELTDTRMLFSDPSLLLRYVKSIKVAGRSLWTQQIVADGLLPQSFVTTCDKYRMSTFTDLKRDGFRLGDIPLSNNSTIEIICGLNPGALSPSIADIVLFGRSKTGVNSAFGKGGSV